MTHIMSRCTVAAVPSGTVVALARTINWVASVATALITSRTSSTQRVELGSPPRLMMVLLESWKDAASGALNIWAREASQVSDLLNVYSVSRCSDLGTG